MVARGQIWRPRRRGGQDLWATSGAALLCAAVVILVPLTAVRAAFATPLCLVLPGYALAAACFSPGRVSGPQRAMVVLALSLATLALGSLLLNALPGGLRLGSWTILVVAVVLVGCAVAAARRHRLILPVGVPATGAGGGAAPRLRGLGSKRAQSDLLLVIFAALIASSALLLSRIPLPAPNAIGYTQLWMFADDSGHTPAVRIGVRSAEKRRTSYRLALTIGTSAPAVVEPHLTLAPGQSSQIKVPLIGIPRPRAIVTAELYKGRSPTVYRQVTALVSAPRGATALP
jgi:uncharacterized membrane protein